MMLVAIIIFITILITATIACALIYNAPNASNLNSIRDGLWKRYTGLDRFDRNYICKTDTERQNADRLLAYVDRLIDRQINKARGILPFNSIIIAALAFEGKRISSASEPILHQLFIFVIISLVVSSGLSLYLFRVTWSNNVNPQSFASEFEYGLILSDRRSKLIDIIIAITGVMLVVGTFLLLMIEFRPPSN